MVSCPELLKQPAYKVGTCIPCQKNQCILFPSPVAGVFLTYTKHNI